MSEPWNNPPQRQTPLRKRRHQRQARRAELWSRRLAEAEELGPEMVAEVQWDRARASLSRLGTRARTRAYTALAEAIDRIRVEHAE